MPLRPVAALVGVLVPLLLVGCGGSPTDLSAGGGKNGATVALKAGTCWTAETLGADPQAILKLSQVYNVNYFEAAPALADRPAFKLTEACGLPHHVEIYKVIGVNEITPAINDFAELLRPDQGAYRLVNAAVERACMGKSLVKAATTTGLPGVVAEPALPDGVELSWAPPSPEQWSRGQRVYACILTSVKPVSYRYSSAFAKSFPIKYRTCIDSSSLTYVGCARKHDRERIAILDLRVAVAAGRIPGRNAIETGANGRFVNLAPSSLAALDRACTSYLRAISKTKKLTGIAEIDADQWPTPDGGYPVACEADVAPSKKPVVTKGSVYDR